MVVTPDTDWFSDPHPTFFYVICDQQMQIHRSGPNECISIDWFPYMNCHSLKLLHVEFIFLFSVHAYCIVHALTLSHTHNHVSKHKHILSCLFWAWLSMIYFFCPHMPTNTMPTVHTLTYAYICTHTHRFRYTLLSWPLRAMIFCSNDYRISRILMIMHGLVHYSPLSEWLPPLANVSVPKQAPVSLELALC